jgi:hypothetical protein
LQVGWGVFMQPLVLDLVFGRERRSGVSGDNKMMEKRCEKNGVKGDGIGGLFFQQTPLYGVHPATAIFFIARAMVSGAALLGLLIIITTCVFSLVMMSLMMAYLDKSRMRWGHILAVANGI